MCAFAQPGTENLEPHPRRTADIALLCLQCVARVGARKPKLALKGLSGIYCFRPIESGRMYIGQAVGYFCTYNGAY